MTSNLSDIRIGSVWVNVSHAGTVHAFDTEHLADFAQEDRLHKLKLVFGWTNENVYTHVASPKIDPNYTLDKTCRWTFDAVHEKWDTQCGTGIVFQEGGPRDNEYSFCPRCGCRIDVGV